MPPPHAVKRLVLVLSGIFAGYLLILSNLFVIQVLEHDTYAAAAERQHKRKIELPSKRGYILDCRGTPLAISAEGLDVYAVPDEVENTRKAAKILATHLGLPRSQLLGRLSSSRSFVLLCQKVNPIELEKLREMKLAGIKFINSSKRYYPCHSLASQVIGYVGLDEIGLTGIEFKYDNLLRGTPGWLVIQRDARGKGHNLLDYPLNKQTDGCDLRLSIEAEFQEIAEQALRRAVIGSQAKNGCIVAVDPHNGKIKALASYPSVNLNSRRSFRKEVLRNLATNQPYEPGSTIKAITGSALLAGGHFTLDEMVNCEQGVYNIRKRTIRDVHPHGNLNGLEVIQHSSNIGTAKLIQRIPDSELYRSLRAFGLGSYTGECFKGEDKGFLPPPSKWDPQTKTSLGIGYGLLVTPLQMAMAYSVLANGGTLFEPALVEKINDENGKCLYRFKPRPVRQVLPRQVAGLMTRALVAVVDSGTGRAAAVPGYKVAGKTGTSMIVNRGGKYDGSGYIASFGGFFPAHDPQLVIFIIINSPAFHKRWGGSVAAPVFSEIIRNTLVSRSEVIDRSRLDLCKPSTYLAGVDQPGAKPVPGLAGKTAHPSVTHPPEPADRPGRTVIMPKVKGFTMRKAVEQLTELGLQVVLSGHIRVREQQPKPGTSLKPGSTCIITGLTAVRKNNTLALAKKDRNPLSRTNAKGDR